MAALFYATVLLGAVEPAVQYHVCLAALAALVLALIAQPTQPVPRPRLTAGLLAVGCLWLLFTALQTVELPEDVARWLSPGLASLRQSYLPETGSAGVSPPQSLSLIPSMTQAVWPIYAIAFAFFWIGLATSSTRRGRTQLLASLAVGGTALSLWGLWQRARGSHLLLPGRDAPDGALPFATLIYKNAGASLLLAALAAAVGLWLTTIRPLLRQRRRRLQHQAAGAASRPTRRGGEAAWPAARGTSAAPPRGASAGRGRPRAAGGVFADGANHRWWLEPRVVAAMVLIGVIAAGLVASLSRGAWIAAAVALLVWVGCCRRDVSTSVLSVCGGALILLAGISVCWPGVRGAVASRAADMDLNVLAENDRIGHWRDAAETFLQYPLTGAGLGTYGYAHLPHLDHDTPRWFHHAHSQPLEWAVETGGVGMALLAAGALLLLAVLADLYRHRSSGSEPLIWFSVGVIAMVSLSVQACADFMVLTPAVMWAYALLLGAVARATVEGASSGWRGTPAVSEASLPASRRSGWKRHLPGVSLRSLGRPLRESPAWAALFATGALFVSQSWLQDHLIDEKLLEVTRLPSERTVAPSPERIERSRELLENRLSERPRQSRLWQRLALWDVAWYRSELLALSASLQAPVQWVHTEPRTLFHIFHSLDPSARDGQRSRWLPRVEQQQAVARAHEHFVNSLHGNPLVPQVHLQLAWLSPLTGQPYRPSAEKCRKLSASEGDLRFELGLLARAAGDRRTMIDQWRRCLRYTPGHFETIVRVADDVLTPQQLAGDLLRDLRSNVWMALVRRSMRQDALADYRQAFLEAARETVTMDADLPGGQRHAYLATLCQYAGDRNGTAYHMRQAVQADPVNADYRYRYAEQLLKDGRLKEARDATTLGRALEPSSPRFTELLERIDRRLTAAAASGSLQLSTLPASASHE